MGWADAGYGSHASLWTGTAASWVDLHPTGTTSSMARGVRDGQQVGRASVDAAARASLWTGSAASWVDLTPAGADGPSYTWGVYGGQQVGGTDAHASLWSGSAASWVDLHAFLPSDFTMSFARGIWGDGVFTYVAGLGYNATTGRQEALMWVGPVPEPASGLVLSVGLSALTLFRRRR